MKTPDPGPCPLPDEVIELHRQLVTACAKYRISRVVTYHLPAGWALGGEDCEVGDRGAKFVARYWPRFGYPSDGETPVVVGRPVVVDDEGESPEVNDARSWGTP